MIDYGVYGNGKFTIIPNGSQNDPFDRLWYLGDNASVLMSGTITTGFLSQFAKAPVTAFNGHYGTTSIAEDAFNVFKFLADQTSVEWGLNGYSTKNGNQFLLRTSRSDEYVSPTNGSFNELDMMFSMHSHPTITIEGASGLIIGPPPARNVSYEKSSDMSVMDNRFNRFNNAGKSWPTQFPDHFVYITQLNKLNHYTHKSNNNRSFNISSGADLMKVILNKKYSR